MSAPWTSPDGSIVLYHGDARDVLQSLPRVDILIEMSSRHGETVLDPFAGSGSTLVAGLLEGRRAIGIEVERAWFDVAVSRLEALTQQLSMFGEASA